MDELSKNGFIIYPKNTLFALQKVSTPDNPEKFDEKIFSSYPEALNFAQIFLKKEFSNYTAIVRYNRKLGVEYKNLPLIFAKNQEDAEKKANFFAKELVGEQHIIEIRVRPKND
jgi:hypothetical protein